VTATDQAWTSALLDLLFDEPSVGRCLVAPDGSVLRVNAEWVRATGFALDDVLGADLIALFPETRDLALALYARARAGHHVDVPRHVQRVAGREVWWEGSLDPVPMEGGGTGLLVTAREVPPEGGAARVRAEGASAEVARVLARIRDIADHAPAAVFVKDGAGRFLFVNRWLLDLLGVRRPGIVGRTVADLLPESVATRIRDHATILIGLDESFAAGSTDLNDAAVVAVTGEVPEAVRGGHRDDIVAAGRAVVRGIIGAVPGRHTKAPGIRAVAIAIVRRVVVGRVVRVL
jgi:PAS domain S-box-containing protein